MKRSKTAKLRRSQLDRLFKEQARAFAIKAPKTGWVKEIREALGMSMADLAARLGVIKQRIEGLEKNEVAGKVTLESLQNAAAAMDCEFVYFFVPKNGLQKTIEQRARVVATDIMKTTEHTMELEMQGTSKAAQKELVEEITRDLLSKEDRRIWRKRSEDPKPARSHTSRR